MKQEVLSEIPAATPEPEYVFVETAAAWDLCLGELRSAPRFAVDIEANSLHAYREQICLIQISTETRDYIIDPLAGLDLAGLGGLLGDARVEKVFHAADYDMSLLKSLYGWDVRHHFDTMWAGRVLGFKKMGLAVVLEEMFGVTLVKKYQKANWGKRPLTAEQLSYARNDTHYLLPLRDALEKRLLEAGCLEEAREIFEGECLVEPMERIFDPESFWGVQGVRALSPRGQAIFRSLYIYRDEEARRRDMPPFKVVNDQMLLRIADEASRRREKEPLGSVPGVSDKLLERLGRHLHQAVARGRRDAPPKQPRRRPPRHPNSPGFAQRYEALLGWRKRKAKERGVESDVIMPRRTAMELAEKNPATDGDLEQIASLGPFRRKRYAGEILKTLRDC